MVVKAVLLFWFSGVSQALWLSLLLAGDNSSSSSVYKINHSNKVAPWPWITAVEAATNPWEHEPCVDFRPEDESFMAVGRLWSTAALCTGVFCGGREAFGGVEER